MDLAGTGHITLKALVRSNDIWAEGCDLVCQIVGGSKVGQEPGFSKEELLGRPGTLGNFLRAELCIIISICVRANIFV